MNRAALPEEPKMTFLEHLEELRIRLIRAAMAVIAGIGICWFFREQIRAFLEAPLYEVWASVPGLPPPEPLRFTSLIEPFMAYLKLSSIAGLFLASPFVFYHLWKFIAPGLYPRERRYVVPFVFISSLLFVAGSLGAYKFVFPAGFAFFLEFSAGGRQEVATVEIHVPDPVVSEPASALNIGGKPVLPTAEPPPQQKLHSTDVVQDTVPDTDTRVDTAAGDMDSADGNDGTDKNDGTDTHPDKDISSVDTERAPPAPAPAVVKPAHEESSVAVTPPESEPETSLAMRLKTFIARQITTPDCGDWRASIADDNAVQLLFSQQHSGCEALQVVEVLRNDQPISLEFSHAPQSMRAIDRPGTGAFRYTITLLQTPQSQGKLSPMLMVTDYLDFAVKLLLAFGLIFELPVLIVFLALAGLVQWRQLLRFSRWFVLIAFVFAAMLTPPDVFTQLMLALPLIVLYLCSILVVYFINRKQNLTG